LLAVGIAPASVLAFSGSTAKGAAAMPALTSYPPATTRIISKLPVLERLARSQATGNEDANVHAGLIVLTTRVQAAGGDVVNSNQPVYELILSERFICVDAAVIPQLFVHGIPHRAPTAVLLDGISFRRA
jgi:hypothetical protein